jgi:hypothetical protein
MSVGGWQFAHTYYKGDEEMIQISNFDLLKITVSFTSVSNQNLI